MISYPRLPVHLFQRDALFSIARLIGEPLRVDDATTKLKSPSVARIQVELARCSTGTPCQDLDTNGPQRGVLANGRL